MLLWGEKKESGQIATRTHILKNEKSSLQMGRINYYWEGEKKEQGKYSPHKKKGKRKRKLEIQLLHLFPFYFSELKIKPSPLLSDFKSTFK